MMDARSLTKTLGGRWCGSYGLAPCPSHDDREPSLKIKDDPRKNDGIDLHCFAGCSWQDVKAEFQRQGLIDDPYIKVANGIDAERRTFIEPKRPNVDHEADQKRRIELALIIWRRAKPLQGDGRGHQDTLGWRYFTERRGLHIGLLDDLSHCLKWDERTSTVIALMTDPVTNQPTGVHRTIINADATKRERKMFGKQGVVRLSRDEDVTQVLGITEGIEDGLAILSSGWAPVWAATSAGAIKRFAVLSSIEALTIFRDDNETGVKAAEACAQRWTEAGREAFIASLKELT